MAACLCSLNGGDKVKGQPTTNLFMPVKYHKDEVIVVREKWGLPNCPVCRVLRQTRKKLRSFLESVTK